MTATRQIFARMIGIANEAARDGRNPVLVRETCG